MEMQSLRDPCWNTRKLYVFKDSDNFTSTVITEENELSYNKTVM